jgi:hypothetical protein
MTEVSSSSTQRVTRSLSFIRRDGKESGAKQMSTRDWAAYFHVDVRGALSEALPKLCLDSSISEILERHGWTVDEEELAQQVREAKALEVYEHHGRHLFFTDSGDWVVVHYRGEEFRAWGDNRRGSTLGATYKFLGYEGFVEIFGTRVFFAPSVTIGLANALDDEVKRLIGNQRAIDQLAFGFRSDAKAERTLPLP